MIHTCTGAGTSQGGDDDGLPPPPPPPGNEFFTQFLGNQWAMEETLRLIAQNMARARQHNQGNQQIFGSWRNSPDANSKYNRDTWFILVRAIEKRVKAVRPFATCLYYDLIE